MIAVAVIANQQQVTQSEFNAQCQQRGQVLVSKLTVLRGELDSFGGWASGLVVQAWLSGRFSTLPFTQTQFTQKISTNASAFPGVDAVVYFNYIASASDRAAWEQAHGLNITQITAVSGGTLVFQREPARPAYLPVANAFPPLLGQAPIGILGWVCPYLLPYCLSVCFLTRAVPRRTGFRSLTSLRSPSSVSLWH